MCAVTVEREDESAHGHLHDEPKPMVTFARAAIVSIVLMLSCGGATPPQTNRESSAVEVWANGCSSLPVHGSGIALGDDLVATAAHVVAGATSVSIDDGRGHSYLADVAAIDAQRDAAVLRVSGLDRPTLRLRAMRTGERGSFFAFGGPQPTLAAFTVVRAVGISSEDIYREGEHVRPGYQLEATVVAGDSGAGLLAEDGTLGGLVWATSRSTEGQAWAIGVEVVSDLLASITARPAAAIPCV
jgi:S1-C subfamily serine protease